MKAAARVNIEWDIPISWEYRFLPRCTGVDNKPAKRLRPGRCTLSRNPFATVASLMISPTRTQSLAISHGNAPLRPAFESVIHSGKDHP